MGTLEIVGVSEGSEVGVSDGALVGSMVGHVQRDEAPANRKTRPLVEAHVGQTTEKWTLKEDRDCENASMTVRSRWFTGKASA